jgi:microcystin-dependent protein
MESYIGQVMLFAGNFAPRGWAPCSGHELPIAQYSALFSILGTTYGGDGRTTFALPKLEGVGGAIYVICIAGVYPPRS